MSLTDDAIDAIKRMIVAGELVPGQRLPREADLAQHLGLSRNSLREAIRALSLVRVLVVRHGDGTYVSDLDPALLLEPLGFVVDLHRGDSALHLLDVRLILEPAATATAATTLVEADLADLRELLDSLDPEPDLEALIAMDLEFHRRIARATGNPVLAGLLDALSSRTQRARLWRGLTQEGAVERTMREHREILAALAARDAEQARARAAVHVGGVRDWLRDAADGQV